MNRQGLLATLVIAFSLPGCGGTHEGCDCGYALSYPQCCISVEVERGQPGVLFIGGPIAWLRLGRVTNRIDTAIALNGGGEGATSFMFVKNDGDTLRSIEYYFEGGYCIRGRVEKDTIVGEAR